MKKTNIMLVINIAILITGCSSFPDIHIMELQCDNSYLADTYIGFYSFTKNGNVTSQEPDLIDLVYYFDQDDCSNGTLMGRDDRPGYIFPIGYKSWKELVKIEPPLSDTESIVGIRPLTKEKKGYAFWVKTNQQGFILAKIDSLQSVSYSDIVSGAEPKLQIEWYWP